MKIFLSIDSLFGVRSRATDDKKGEEWQKKIMAQAFLEFLNNFVIKKNFLPNNFSLKLDFSIKKY